MTTMGLRGTLACALIVSTGLLTGMGAMPSGAAASEPYSAGLALPSAAGPGLFERVKRKACEVSLAASRSDRSDRSGHRDRIRQCDH